MTRQRSEVRKDFLHSMFVTAMEGGIGYWSQATAYKWSKPGDGFEGRVEDVDGFYAKIVSDEGWGIDGIADDAELRIDIDVIARGVNLFCKQVAEGKLGDPGGGDYFNELVKASRTNGRDGDYDAFGADCVVQLGLFGKVVYS